MLRHLLVHNVQGKTIHQGRLSYSGFAHYQYVRFGAPPQDFYHHTGFPVTTNNRVCLSLSGQQGAVYAVFE